MKTALQLAMVWSLLTGSVAAEQRFIVRTAVGQVALTASCVVLGCNVAGSLGDPAAQVFLLKVPDTRDAATILNALQITTGLISSESDQLVRTADYVSPVPDALYQSDPVTWFGSTARYGFIFQPPAQIIRVLQSQASFGVTGSGIVAVVDTGVDTEHPTLRSALLPGYDFTRNVQGSDEKGDVTQSTTGVVDNAFPFFVNSRVAALLDAGTAALIGSNSAFGHGTMVAGIVHLIAPGAQILPLKAFRPDGTGYASDVLRAVYYAVAHGARVVNMSFTFSAPSPELKRAIDYAAGSGVICVAAAGNDGSPAPHYPAGYKNVIAVASTGDLDAKSSFSNYGADWVWVAAPGEAIVTTYPYGTVAAGWGTSFSAPFVSGTVALLLQADPGLSFQTAASAVAQAQPVSPDMGHGRLDIYRAVQSVALLP